MKFCAAKIDQLINAMCKNKCAHKKWSLWIAEEYQDQDWYRVFARVSDNQKIQLIKRIRLLQTRVKKKTIRTCEFRFFSKGKKRAGTYDKSKWNAMISEADVEWIVMVKRKAKAREKCSKCKTSSEGI